MQNSQVKNRLQHRRFSVNFAEFINNTSFKERLRWLLVFGMYDLLVIFSKKFECKQNWEIEKEQILIIQK